MSALQGSIACSSVSIGRKIAPGRRQLASSRYMAGDQFTVADISVTYALNLGANHAGFILSDEERAYLARTTGRDAYKRAIDRSHPGVVT
jgi:glutathione S-transferase